MWGPKNTIAVQSRRNGRVTKLSLNWSILETHLKLTQVWWVFKSVHFLCSLIHDKRSQNSYETSASIPLLIFHFLLTFSEMYTFCLNRTFACYYTALVDWISFEMKAFLGTCCLGFNEMCSSIGDIRFSRQNKTLDFIECLLLTCIFYFFHPNSYFHSIRKIAKLIFSGTFLRLRPVTTWQISSAIGNRTNDASSNRCCWTPLCPSQTNKW